jgi:flagellar basal body rod protein FlgB
VTFDGSLRNDANTVDLESEMTALADTQLRFGAVSRLATARLGMLRDVASGGR